MAPAPKRPRLSGGETNAAEDALMASLLSGLDESMFESPSPSKSQSHESQRSQVAQSRSVSQPKPSSKPTTKLTPTPAAARHEVTPRSEVRRSPIRHCSRSPIRAAQPLPAAKGKESGSSPKRELDAGDLLDVLNAPLKKVRAEGASFQKCKAGAEPQKPLPKPFTVQSSKPPQPLDSATGTTALSSSVPATAIPASQDEYDMDWDLDGLAELDMSAFVPAAERINYPIRNPTPPPTPEGYEPTPWVRCVVDSVHDGILDALPDEYPDDPVSQWGKTIIVTIDGTRRLVHLKERWADIKVRPKDVVNIISPAIAGRDAITVTMKDPTTYIVHHPDALVTMTAIANSMPCPRRPLLQNLARLPEPPSKAMLYGNILHALLQGSLLEQSFDPAATSKRVADELSKDYQRLQVWGAGLDDTGVTQDLVPNAQEAFAAFGRKWVGSTPKSDGTVVTARDESVGTLAITGLHEVEEDIWSVKWGLKGKVDASVQIKLKREGSEEEELVAPLEIKTGRSIGGVRHRAQTLLYTLLLQDRYGLPVPSGLLYYSQRDAVVLVDARDNEVRALMMARNELADWMVRPRVTRELDGDGGDGDGDGPIEEPFLPETIDRIGECKNCYVSDLCMVYRKAVDRVPPPEKDELFELYDEKTMHLTPEHAAFFAHWERLLTLEEHDTIRLRAQLWTMTANARQRSGRCFADMVITKEESEVGKATKISRWAYTFIRKPSDSLALSLLSGHIARGDPVSLSLEPDILCLSRGFVTEITPESVTVSVQAQLDVEKLLKRVRRTDGPTPVFRIDKDEMASGMTRMRGNLAYLFVKDGDARRRRLVVDLAKPKFDQIATKPSEVVDNLNEDQQAAMAKVLTARDYALILGMPGTGKTTIVAAIIKAIVARGQTVLLTSYTHSAVDTIVTKLLNADFEVLRIGNPDKVHPEVRHLTLDSRPISSSEDLERRLMSPQVVATTALSIEHPLFFRRRFDYCIVDEASQVTLPTCIGPLRCTDKFVLVGDHFQLPPIVRRAEARDGGLDVSLFRRLSDAHPDSVAPLESQYRMNSDIMLLSNHLIYENRLRCGSEEVANQALVLPSRRTCAEIGGEIGDACGTDCWVQHLMEESSKAIFVDTDQLPAPESRAGDLVQNEGEAALVHTFASALLASGIDEKDMAVITPYRQQIKLLSRVLGDTAVEILTADKAQGRDKDVIIVSLVRSNEEGQIGDLLRDWRRINVSFTRAKRKLVILGSRGTLGNNPLLREFFELMEGKGWILRLKKGDERVHRSIGEEIKEEVKEEVKVEKGVKKGKMSERVLSGRPFVREVLQEMNV